MTASRPSSPRPDRTLVVLVALAAAAWGAGARAQDPWSPRERDPLPCWREFDEYDSGLARVRLPNRSPLDLEDAMTRFRLERREEALERIETARTLLKGAWRWRFPPDARVPVSQALEAFHDCIMFTPPQAMVTLTIRASLLEEGEFGDRGAAFPGAIVKFDGMAVGRTGPDGTLTLRAPSGPIRVTVEIPPSYWGEEYTAFPAGVSGVVSVWVHGSKEGAEDTRLVLVEAVDDIIPVAAESFTLRFLRDDQPAAIERINEIDLLGRDDSIDLELMNLFTLRDGAIAAKQPAALFSALGGRLERTLTLRVNAQDTTGGVHHARVRFRVGQSALVVRLEAPPSNRSLSVSDIEVGVSLVGAGIAVQRVSDAGGRFEIDWLPHGTIALECATMADGRYYYGQATMMHSDPREVALVLRHVSDIVAGVPALKLHREPARNAPPRGGESAARSTSAPRSPPSTVPDRLPRAGTARGMLSQ